MTPSRPGHGARRRCDLALLGCATLLGAVGLGADVAEARAGDGEEQRRWLDGLFFPRPSRFPRGLSPTGRPGSRRDDTTPGLAPSATLVSLSSVSDCNSTRSLLRSDSDEAAPAAPSPPPSPPAPSLSTNPLVDVELESFKKDPRQSLTPTHVTAAHAVSRGHRRTPSDGALRQREPPEVPNHGECGPCRAPFTDRCPGLPSIPRPHCWGGRRGARDAWDSYRDKLGGGRASPARAGDRWQPEAWYLHCPCSFAASMTARSEITRTLQAPGFVFQSRFESPCASKVLF